MQTPLIIKLHAPFTSNKRIIYVNIPHQTWRVKRKNKLAHCRSLQMIELRLIAFEK